MSRKKLNIGVLFLAMALVALPGASATTTYYGDLQSEQNSSRPQLLTRITPR